MRWTLIAQLKKDQKLSDLLDTLRAMPAKENGEAGKAGNKLAVNHDYRTRPYLDHTVVDWVDGPPNSNVVAVISAKDPSEARWRRITLTRRSANHYELDAFPTPFKNATDPLSPGIPPGASRKAP